MNGKELSRPPLAQYRADRILLNLIREMCARTAMGKVGDGRVMVKCQTCDGTGKKLKAQKEKESADKSAGNFQCRAFC